MKFCDWFKPAGFMNWPSDNWICLSVVEDWLNTELLNVVKALAILMVRVDE